MSAAYSFVSAALPWAKRGVPVFPVGTQNKRPLTGRGGYKNAAADEKQIREWGKRYPRARVGINLEAAGLLAVDTDPRHGGDRSLDALIEEHGLLPRTWCALTPSGGTHHYFKNPNGIRSAKLANGIDIKAIGGYVVVPESTGYSWHTSPAQVELADLPTWISERLTSSGDSANDGEEKPPLAALLADPPPEGGDGDWEGRNVWLATVAGHYAHHFDRQGDYEHHVLEAGALTDPPMDRQEVLTVAESIWRRERSKERPRSGNPIEALNDSRVDLVTMIKKGIPPREYVPGCEPWLVAGARYLVPAPAGTGKSLFGLVVAVNVVEAGGSAVILDVENGADEYARRLNDLLSAQDSDDTLTADCGARLRYHAWPDLKTDWVGDEWAAANTGVDLVIFDSSRLVLSASGLDEDKSGDYAEFVNGLLIPLAKSGATTIVLDNMGHETKKRARGSSAKADLNEVVYVARVHAEFDRDRRGELRLERTRTRFADLPGELRLPVGGGTYGPATVVNQSVEKEERLETRREQIRHAVMLAVKKEPGLNKRELRKALRGYSADEVDVAARALEGRGRLRVEPGQRGARRHFPNSRHES